MDRHIREKRVLQGDIALAVERNELELHFQPQAMTGGEVFGFEVPEHEIQGHAVKPRGLNLRYRL
jgi:hypothetical protein